MKTTPEERQPEDVAVLRASLKDYFDDRLRERGLCGELLIQGILAQHEVRDCVVYKAVIIKIDDDTTIVINESGEVL